MNKLETILFLCCGLGACVSHPGGDASNGGSSAAGDAAANPGDSFDQPTSKPGDDGGSSDAGPSPDVTVTPYPVDSEDASCNDGVGDFTPCMNPSQAQPDTGLMPCLTTALCTQLEAVALPSVAAAAMACLSQSPEGCVPEDYANCLAAGAEARCPSESDAGDPTCNQIASTCGSTPDADVDSLLVLCNSIAPGLTSAGKSTYMSCATSTCTVDGLNGCAGALLQ